jgi:hypothetical protein
MPSSDVDICIKHFFALLYRFLIVFSLLFLGKRDASEIVGLKLEGEVFIHNYPYSV